MTIPATFASTNLTPEERRLLDEWKAKEERRKAMEALARKRAACAVIVCEEDPASPQGLRPAALIVPTD